MNKPDHCPVCLKRFGLRNALYQSTFSHDWFCIFHHLGLDDGYPAASEKSHFTFSPRGGAKLDRFVFRIGRIVVQTDSISTYIYKDALNEYAVIATLDFPFHDVVLNLLDSEETLLSYVKNYNILK